MVRNRADRLQHVVRRRVVDVAANEHRVEELELDGGIRESGPEQNRQRSRRQQPRCEHAHDRVEHDEEARDFRRIILCQCGKRFLRRRRLWKTPGRHAKPLKRKGIYLGIKRHTIC